MDYSKKYIELRMYVSLYAVQRRLSHIAYLNHYLGALYLNKISEIASKPTNCAPSALLIKTNP